MYGIILLIHVLIALALIGLVLMQQGKGAEAGAAFGGGASQTVFGAQGSTSFLVKLTGGLAAAFFVTSLGLGYLAVRAVKQNKVQSLAQKVVQQVPGAELPIGPATQVAQKPVTQARKTPAAHIAKKKSAASTKRAHKKPSVQHASTRSTRHTAKHS